MIALAIPFGIGIGLVVGAVGGGGAILALPVLVYVLDEGVGAATTASLVVVAVAAAFGGGSLAREGRVDWPSAAVFALPAAAGALAGTQLSAEVGPREQIIAFVPVMLVAAAGLLWRVAADPDEDPERERPPLLASGTVGLAVGLLTGFFGVGGGFLIVPALTFLGLELHRAVATSLTIIALTGTVALAGHLADGAQPNWTLTVVLSVATGLGAIAGARAGSRLPADSLARGFAGLIVAVAAFLLVDVVALGGPPTA